MERDPVDGKVAFFPAVANFEIETIEDAYLALDGLRKAAEQFKEYYDIVGYPVLQVEEQED